VIPRVVAAAGARGERHALSQQAVARRAGTTQKHISRIERGEISPSLATRSRVLAAMGERLELHVVPGLRDNRFDEELRADYEQLTASERLALPSGRPSPPRRR